MENNAKRYGFIPDVYSADQYVLGAEKLPKKVLRPDGQWDASMPTDEIQRDNGVETMNCTVYGTENAIEFIGKEKFGKRWNWSERFIGIAANTTPQGNSPHVVGEAIRKFGLVENADLPFSDEIDTWDKYYSPKPLTQELLDKGRAWLSEYVFGHEWVYQPADYQNPAFDYAAAIMEALKYSPVGVSVYAWWKGPDGYYRKNGLDNHWAVVYGYKEGKYWKVFDSYDNTRKKVAWDTWFMFAKRYHLEERTEAEKDAYFKEDDIDPNTMWFITIIKKLLTLIKPKKNSEIPPFVPPAPAVEPAPEAKPVPAPLSPRERLYEVAKASLGIDASPKDVAPDEFGCAESVNEIHFKAFGTYIEKPGISTTRLFHAMVEQQELFVRVSEPLFGDIIISPTGYGTGAIPNGHVGIVGKHGIMSNSSATGKFEQNFTIGSWVERYRKKGGYPIYFFRRV